MISYHRANEVLSYDPEDGKLFWKLTIGKRAKKGGIAGCKTEEGYIRIKVDRKNYLAHRIVWLLAYGAFPENEVDHKDRDKANNRLSNLRACTSAENAQNRGIISTNKTGIANVFWHKHTRKWTSAISVGGKKKHLGVFTTKDEAKQTHVLAKKQMHHFHSAPPIDATPAIPHD